MTRSWKNTHLLAIVVAVAFATVAAAGEPKPEDYAWADGYVVVLGSGSSFKSVEKQAKQIARKTHVRYDDMDRDLKNPDFGWWGRLSRDGDKKPFVSVECSEVYKLKKQYVVVGAVTYTLSEAKRELARYRATVPDAYIRKFKQYMGCRS